jgi:hypothetical protein
MVHMLATMCVYMMLKHGAGPVQFHMDISRPATADLPTHDLPPRPGQKIPQPANNHKPLTVSPLRRKVVVLCYLPFDK